MALYHDTDNGPVEVKKHQIMGPVGYTVVGTPTITDGIASGFNNNNRLQLNSTYRSTNTKNTKWHIRFKTPSTITSSFNPITKESSDGVVFGIWTYGNYLFVVRLGSQNGNELFFNDIYPNNGDVLPNTWYVCEVTGNNGIWKAEIFSDDGTSLGSNVKDFSSYTVSVDYNLLLQPTSSDGNYSGSIDLNSTYIKINDELWFYQPQETKYIIRENPRTQEQHIVYAKPNMYLAGPVNYTIVGSPTIVDGVASGFVNNTNYLQLSTLPQNYNLEFVFKFKLEETNRINYLYGMNYTTTVSDTRQGGILINGSNRLEVACFFDGSNRYYSGNYQFSVNTDYWVKVIISSNSIDAYYSTDGILYTPDFSNSASFSDMTFTGTTRLGVYDGYVPNSELKGSIDFNNTYIKVNDNLWFYGKNYSSKNIAPVPSGFTYGSTTTNAIGWVDMRTQEFHPAPAGTGYNEVPQS